MAVQVIVDGDAGMSRVELVISVAGHDDFVAEEKGADMFACFDICIDRAEKQLTRFKDRIRDRKHQARASQGEAEI
jgi:ribosomal subunit interface protein